MKELLTQLTHCKADNLTAEPHVTIIREARQTLKSNSQTLMKRSHSYSRLHYKRLQEPLTRSETHLF